jgi:hypothetical protein
VDDEQKIDVSFYGYVRGSSYRINTKVYITGLGDFEISEIKTLDDPCPPVLKQTSEHL